MVLSAPARRSLCPACAGPTRAPALCPECFEAFAVARRAHPTAAGPLVPSGFGDAAGGHDTDMWDAWSLLGDAGGHPLRGLPD